MTDRKRFTCSYNRIELIITYKCNLRCYNCDAMVPQAISSNRMTIEQINKFVSESIEKKVFWRHIRVLGGEPTLHKDILKFLEILLKYKADFSPETKIQLITNGYGEKVKEVLKKIPKDIEIENSAKTSDINSYFSPVNQAPIDMPEYKDTKDSEYSKGCWIPSLCGIALDMHGYYPCSAAAAIDRVFGYDLGKKELPVRRGTLESVFKDFCKLCGHFYDKINEHAPNNITTIERVEEFEKLHEKKFPETQNETPLVVQVTSPTWEKALDDYKKSPPQLKRY